MQENAFAALCQDACRQGSQLEHVLSRARSMHLLTDSKSILNVISKDIHTSIKCKTLDTHVILQAHKLNKVSNIVFVRTNYNYEYGLTNASM